jgi:hypothetical protein
MINQFTRRCVVLSIACMAVVPTGGLAATPLVTVHKDPDCGCCGGWIAHLEVQGFPTKTIETRTINRVKARMGVPYDLWACHTAEVAGYIIEGHVPAQSIRKLLSERPKARGLAVPGMPSGSPGMTGDFEEYDVILFDNSNERRSYGKFKGEKQI